MSAVQAQALPPGSPRRLTGGAALGRSSSRDAKQVAAAVLAVLAGERTPSQAAEALGLSLLRYYQIEAAALRGLLAACEPKSPGRQPDPATEVAALRRRAAQLERDLARQQALVRLTQRAAGLAAAPPPKPAAAGKRRKRRPAARASTVAQRLRAAAEAAPPAGGDTGVTLVAES